MDTTWDAIVIGSGFGGAMAAYPLVHAGQRVLMLERGAWVLRGSENVGPTDAGLAAPVFNYESPGELHSGRRRYPIGTWNCVGGQSVFYGGASFRFRESDFSADGPAVERSNATWPFTYDDLEPFYGMAEQLLGVAGSYGDDPCEPRRSTPFRYTAAPLSRPARAIADAAVRVGLRPSRIPLAISYEASVGRRGCIQCGTCDGYACAAEAKNDLATGIIPALVRHGMVVRANTVCVRLVRNESRIVDVECVDGITGEVTHFRAGTIVLAAGAVATPQLLLASNLARVNPAAASIGRYLTRHRNALTLGVFARMPNPEHTFDKQLAIFDLYHEAGSLQQLTPNVGLVRFYLPRLLREPGVFVARHASGLLAIAEDEPRFENGVSIDWSRTDRFGMPMVRVRQTYTERDERAARMLVRIAKRVLRESGALFCLVQRIETLSHALGTVRMGVDPRTSPLDGDGRYRGLDNLYVTDGSALPRSAAVNPSLTIAANALRIGSRIAGAAPVKAGRALRTIAHTLIPADR
ncbi:MAG TPA: GMC family oxidoreductase [Gemmatimonadaceae bacterium]|nr:GMC family oxidoreductase [Gemmatimonadaceae bacterium]